MADRTIVSGFRDPGGAEDSDQLARYLEYVDSLPQIRQIKERSYRYLCLKDGDVVLDAGCGPGYDVLRMAAVIGSGRVTGIDASRQMIAIARANAEGSGLPVSFQFGNVNGLEFPDGMFDAVREERTLQILDMPGQALDELVRVLRPGGRLAAIEPDWETFVVDPGDRDVGRRFFGFCCDQFPDGSTGRKLYRYFRDRELCEVTVHAEPVILHDPGLFFQLMNVKQFLPAAQGKGVLSDEEADRWCSDLQAAGSEGRFTFAGLIFTVTGRK
jgi:ubiquinone/menaquinone biosynthesis C-methylase UbiE